MSRTFKHAKLDHQNDTIAVSNAWYYWMEYKDLIKKYQRPTGKFDNIAYIGLTDREYLEAIRG